MTRFPPSSSPVTPSCPLCGSQSVKELDGPLSAGTHGTVQCERCGAVFTYSFAEKTENDEPPK